MSDQVHEREFYRSLERRLSERAQAERYWARQQQAKSGAGANNRARPLEFDESGFPVAQPNPSFVARVTKLLRPS